MSKLVIIASLLLFSICAIESRTIRWTSAGGTSLWEFPKNWDCNCVPTADDDVIIDVPNIPGVVRISAVASTCKSLTVGGSSNNGQTLTVQGSLTVGAGGVVINPNGAIELDSSPDAPLVCDGIFSGSNRFLFNSGTLAGKGQFIYESLNMTSSALKQINASTTVRGILWVQPGAGQNGLINVAQQTLQVIGQLRTSEALTIFTDDSQSASLDVTGLALFDGPGKQFIIRGYASIANLNVNAGQLTIQNSVDIQNSTIGQAGSIMWIGGPENQRNFGFVGGSGVLVVQGGTNTLSGANIATLQLVSGKVTNDNTATIGTLSITGGEFAGKGKISATSTSLGSGTLTGITLTTSNLDLNGFTTLNGAVINLGTSGKVSAPAQFTLNTAAAQFHIQSGAQFTQSADFGLVPGADPNPPQVVNDGTWTASASANIVVNVAGSGKFSFQKGSTLAATGITFTTNSLDVATTAKFLGVTGQIGTLSGTGYAELNGKQFTFNTVTVSNISHINGQTTISSGSGISYLEVDNGNFIVNQVSVTTFNFSAGTVQGTSSSSAIHAGNAFFTGNIPKFLTTASIIADYINWACKSSCQIVSNDGVIQNSVSVRKPFAVRQIHHKVDADEE